MEPSGGWRPVLPDSHAAQALDLAEEIAADLRRRAASAAATEPLPVGRTFFSLSGGMAGQALFFAYLDRARPERGYDETAMELIEGAFDELDRTDAQPGLFAGLTGVAWMAEHLRGWLVDDEEDTGEAIAERLASFLETRPWILEFDLISGLAGYGVYGIERSPRSFARECVERTVARLTEQAERRPEGIAWWTEEGGSSAEEPRGHFNMGVAHDSPGIIGLLGRVCASGMAAAEARPLLDEAVAWLLAQASPPGAPSRFPRLLVPGQEAEPSRLAWCYGDLGISVALLSAARYAGEPEWERFALDVARAAAARPFAASGVRDAGICHGAAGNAHLFNRLWQATGDPDFAAAARSWLARVLEMRLPGEGIGGFLAEVPDHRRVTGWRHDPGFLTGSAGIGLVLLAAATAVEPAWDRLLLADIPSRGGRVASPA